MQFISNCIKIATADFSSRDYHMDDAMIYIVYLVLFYVTTSVSLTTEDSPVSSTGYCATTLHEFEASVKSNPLNIANIDDGFFHPNSRLSLWITINIYYVQNDDVNTTDPNTIESLPDFTFQWFDIPLFLYIDPRVNQLLSGVLFSATSETINIVIDPLCHQDLKLLNKLVLKVCYLIL